MPGAGSAVRCMSKQDMLIILQAYTFKDPQLGCGVQHSGRILAQDVQGPDLTFSTGKTIAGRKKEILCIIPYFPFSCPRCLASYLFVLRLYLAYLKVANQNNFQLSPWSPKKKIL